MLKIIQGRSGQGMTLTSVYIPSKVSGYVDLPPYLCGDVGHNPPGKADRNQGKTTDTPEKVKGICWVEGYKSALSTKGSCFLSFADIWLSTNKTGNEKMKPKGVSKQTEDFDLPRIQAGKLNETGITFKLVDHQDLQGKNGTFYRISGVANPGEKDELAFVIDYSSGKLHNLLSKMLDVYMNNFIWLAGRGKEYTRNYDVVLVDVDIKGAIHQEKGKILDLVAISKKETLD